jgi:hypothetical protein
VRDYRVPAHCLSPIAFHFTAENMASDDVVEEIQTGHFYFQFRLTDMDNQVVSDYATMDRPNAMCCSSRGPSCATWPSTSLTRWR